MREITIIKDKLLIIKAFQSILRNMTYFSQNLMRKYSYTCMRNGIKSSKLKELNKNARKMSLKWKNKDKLDRVNEKINL